jgi:hypothetical protein
MWAVANGNAPAAKMLLEAVRVDFPSQIFEACNNWKGKSTLTPISQAALLLNSTS